MLSRPTRALCQAHWKEHKPLCDSLVSLRAPAPVAPASASASASSSSSASTGGPGKRGGAGARGPGAAPGAGGSGEVEAAVCGLYGQLAEERRARAEAEAR